MLIRIDFEDNSMVFQNPVKVFLTKNIDAIKDDIDQIMSFVNQGYYAAGYLSYESSQGFNTFNTTKPPQENKLPLLLIGIFDGYTRPNDESIAICHDKLDLKSNTTPSEYNDNINYIKQQIEQGNTYQTNYTIRFNTKFNGDPLTYYRFLQQNNQANYCAYIQFNDMNILSISPELFFKIEGDMITTKPMKGTAARGINIVEDALKLKELFSEKNQAENMMIVDLLRNDLSRISVPATVSVTQLFAAEKYPTVWQLTSTIQSQLKPNISLYQILQALFPCGSITGAPKASTMKIIADIEKQPREVYCGTIGVIEPFLNKAIFNIPIRTLSIDKNEAHYGVGGGVTWDSTHYGEYNEIIEKTAILNACISVPEYLLESLLLADGMFFLLDQHLQRLHNSSQYFDFKLNLDEIKNSLINVSQLNSVGIYKIRLCLKIDGTFTIDLNPIVDDMNITVLNLSSNHINSNNIYLYHKTSNRAHLPMINAGEEYLLFNERKEITEFVNGNIALFINHKWVTPKLNSGLLPGVMRQHYLKQGILTEEIILLTDLYQAQKIAFINSVRKWIPIEQNLFDRLKTQLDQHH